MEMINGIGLEKELKSISNDMVREVEDRWHKLCRHVLSHKWTNNKGENFLTISPYLTGIKLRIMVMDSADHGVITITPDNCLKIPIDPTYNNCKQFVVYIERKHLTEFKRK